MAIGLGADRAVAAFKAGDTPAALRAMAHCLDRMRRRDPDSSLRAAYCHRLVRHAVLWLDTQIEGRETKIDGKPIEMVAGACSNPEPPDSIVDLPCGPLDLAWYMLAEAEISAECNVGVEASLRTKLQDGPILFMEVSVHNRHLNTDVARSDAHAFAAHLGGYLAALALIRAQGKAARDNFDIMAPPRGEIPPLAAPYNENTELEARDAILAFELTAHFNGYPDPENDLHAALIATLGSDFPGKTAFERRGDDPDHPLESTVRRAVAVLRAGGHVEPRGLWEMALRLFERVRQSGFKSSLVPMVARWIRARWRTVIDEESFRLSHPMINVPPLEALLATAENDDAFVAAFLLAAADAVGSPLSVDYMKLLRELAKRAPRAVDG